MKPILFAAMLLALSASNTKAQIAAYTKTINSTGGSFSTNGNIHEWSIGEMPLVSTFSNPGIMVTQGVLQSDYKPLGITDAGNLPDLVRVFPNPSKSMLNLQYDFKNEGSMVYELLDATGKTILQHSLTVSAGRNTETFSVESLADGHYILNVFYLPAGAGAGSTISFKIEKY